MKKNHDVSPEKARRIVEKWREGWSVSRIAQAIKGVSAATVRQICAETGYRPHDLNPKPRGPSRKWTLKEIDTLRQMLSAGETYTKIAESLNRSVDRVREKAADLQCNSQSLPRARPRRCLRCNKLFNSEGPHNRICDECKRHDVYSGFAVYLTGIGRK